MEMLSHSSSAAYPSSNRITVGACSGLTGHLLYSRSRSFGSVCLRNSLIAAATQKKTDFYCHFGLAFVDIVAQQPKTMASHLQDEVIVLMGVSGAGKSTIGELLAKRLNSKFLDADDFHPQANKDKMRDGIPLTDEDRIPWLETLRDKLGESLEGGRPVILACSALRKGYREILRSADPDYEFGSYKSKIRFVLLNAKADVLAERIRKRSAEGKHFMPVKLLQSQLDLLQIEDYEGISKIDATLTPQEIVSTVVNSLTY